MVFKVGKYFDMSDYMNTLKCKRKINIFKEYTMNTNKMIGYVIILKISLFLHRQALYPCTVSLPENQFLDSSCNLSESKI